MRAIAALVKAKGRSWLVYDECDRVDDARLDIEQIAKLHDVLAAVHELAPNLSFPKMTVHTMMQMLYEMYKDEPNWTLAEGHIDDYVITMTRRFHVRQTRRIKQMFPNKDT